jgi:hypothetical protein
MNEDLVELLISGEEHAALARADAVRGRDTRPRLDLYVFTGIAQRYPVFGAEAGRDGFFAHDASPWRATLSPRGWRR